MPTYDYECAKCGRFEAFQKMSDRQFETCPTCGGSVKRLISISAVLFKGEGFHTTDNRSSDYKKKATEDKVPAEAKSETKSETKTEIKSDSGKAKDSKAS